MAAPPPGSGSTESSLNRLLEEVRQRQRGLRTLVAQFVQIRTSDLLVEPERSEGRFWYSSPNQVHWEYLKPRLISLWIDGDRMITWFRDLGRAEERRIGRASSQALRYLHAPNAVAELEQYFTVTLAIPRQVEPYRLELEPRFARLERRLRRLVMWIDREMKLPIRIEFEDPRGQKTEYRFLNLEIDTPIAPGQLEPQLPASVALERVAPGKAAAKAKFE